MTENVKNLWVFFFTLISFMKSLFKSFVHFHLDFVLFFKRFVGILYGTAPPYNKYSSFVRYIYPVYFLPFCGLPFHFLNDVFWRKEVLILLKYMLSILSFLIHAFLVLSEKALPVAKSRHILLCFLHSFSFTFSSSICLKLICLYCETEVRCSMFPCDYAVVPTSFVENTLFSALKKPWHLSQKL